LGWGRGHPKASSSLSRWIEVVKAAEWKNFAELRKAFASADFVTVESGRKVVVFNIGGNDYRLIAAVHFNSGKVFAMRFCTHKEYDKEKWKEEL
jgi:mRNA interferase HigB